MGKGQSKRQKEANGKGPIDPNSPLGQVLMQWDEDYLRQYTAGLMKVTMINFCRVVWPKYPIGPDGMYNWNPEGETDKYWMTQLKKYLVTNKKDKEKPYLEVWFQVRFFGPDPPPVSQFPMRKKGEESDEESHPVPSAPPAI